MVNWLITGAIGVLAALVREIIKLLWGLLSKTAFATPDVTRLPQLATLTDASVAIVNVGFILAILTAGVVVMARETVQTRYGVSELAPRLVIGWIAANFAIPVCQELVRLANALTTALVGDDIGSKDSFARLLRVVTDALNHPASALLSLVLGLVMVVLTGMLIVTYIARVGVLIVLVGVAPVALACHATPYTDPAARLWWRAMLGTLATVVLQAIALHAALSIFLYPDADLTSLGVPDDPTGMFNLFVVVCLMWVVVKIPGLMRRYVTRGGGGHNVAGVIVRTVLVQQLAGMLRLPSPGRGGGRAAAAGRLGPGGGRSGSGSGGFRLPQPLGGGGGGRSTPGGGRWSPRPRPGGGGPQPGGGAAATGRPVRPYTRQELAAGVDVYTRAVLKRQAQSRSTRPPIRAAGVQPPTAAGPRPVIPNGVTPATAMPRTRPVRPPVSGAWNRPTRRR